MEKEKEKSRGAGSQYRDAWWLGFGWWVTHNKTNITGSCKARLRYDKKGSHQKLAQTQKKDEGIIPKWHISFNI
jgi:hypothetical protein